MAFYVVWLACMARLQLRCAAELPRNSSRRVALVPSLIQACFTKPPTLPTSSSQAIDLEMRCLKNLRWRLGPYCCAAPART